MHINEQEQKVLYTAISQGDEAAFATFYDFHFDRLASAVFYVLKDREETEEVLQDVFFSVWNRRTEIASILNMQNYLSVLARNAALNKIKSNVRRKAVESRFMLENTLLYTCPESVAVDTRLDELVNEAIAQLPAQQQRAYVLSRFGRKKYLEIAAEMEISRETVKKYLQLASSSVKTYLIKRKDSIISVLFTFFIF